MEVPLARGLATRTTIWTEPVAPAARLPGDEVWTSEVRVPAAVAETKVVLAGTVSVRTTPVALALPVRSEERGEGRLRRAATGSGESVLETARIGAEVTAVETEAPLTGLVSLESML